MDDDLIGLVVADARERMDKAVDHAQAEFGRPDRPGHARRWSST